MKKVKQKGFWHRWGSNPLPSLHTLGSNMFYVSCLTHLDIWNLLITQGLRNLKLENPYHRCDWGEAFWARLSVVMDLRRFLGMSGWWFEASFQLRMAGKLGYDLHLFFENFVFENLFLWQPIHVLVLWSVSSIYNGWFFKLTFLEGNMCNQSHYLFPKQLQNFPKHEDLFPSSSLTVLLCWICDLGLQNDPKQKPTCLVHLFNIYLI